MAELRQDRQLTSNWILSSSTRTFGEFSCSSHPFIQLPDFLNTLKWTTADFEPLYQGKPGAAQGTPLK